MEKSQKSDIPPIRRQTSVPVRHQYIFVDFRRTSCYNIATTPATHYANSYYSAAETGLYYLQSRYYNPTWGRFISADSYVANGQGILGNNMFAYCKNNPIIFSDQSGKAAVLATLGMMFIGGLIGVASQFICGAIENKAKGATGSAVFQETGSLGDYVAAFVSGAVAAIPGGGALATFVCNVGAPAIQQGTDYLASRMNTDPNDDYYWQTGKFVMDVASNFIFDAAFSKCNMEMPQFIRDIKADAHAAGYKGTKQLSSYLKKQQWFVFGSNQLFGVGSDVTSVVVTMAYGNLSYLAKFSLCS